MALGRRVRVDLPQLERMLLAARNPGVDHIDILVDQSTTDIVSYLLIDGSGMHWLPMYRRRDGVLVYRDGRPIEAAEPPLTAAASDRDRREQRLAERIPNPTREENR